MNRSRESFRNFSLMSFWRRPRFAAVIRVLATSLSGVLRRARMRSLLPRHRLAILQRRAAQNDRMAAGRDRFGDGLVYLPIHR